MVIHMLFYLMEKIDFFLNLDTLYPWAAVNHTFHWTFSRLIYHIKIYCFTVLCHCIHEEYSFKLEYAEKKASVFFLSIIPKLYLV